MIRYYYHNRARSASPARKQTHAAPINLCQYPQGKLKPRKPSHGSRPPVSRPKVVRLPVLTNQNSTGGSGFRANRSVLVSECQTFSLKLFFSLPPPFLFVCFPTVPRIFFSGVGGGGVVCVNDVTVAPVLFTLLPLQWYTIAHMVIVRALLEPAMSHNTQDSSLQFPLFDPQLDPQCLPLWACAHVYGIIVLRHP